MTRRPGPENKINLETVIRLLPRPFSMHRRCICPTLSHLSKAARKHTHTLQSGQQVSSSSPGSSSSGSSLPSTPASPPTDVRDERRVQRHSRSQIKPKAAVDDVEPLESEAHAVLFDTRVPPPKTRRKKKLPAGLHDPPTPVAGISYFQMRDDLVRLQSTRVQDADMETGELSEAAEWDPEDVPLSMKLTPGTFIEIRKYVCFFSLPLALDIPIRLCLFVFFYIGMKEQQRPFFWESKSSTIPGSKFLSA